MPNQIVSIFHVPIPEGQDVEAFGGQIRGMFEKRAKAVDKVAGFQGFELMSAIDDVSKGFIVVTRWADKASYESYLASDAFARGHGGDKYDPNSSRPYEELWESLPIS